MIRRKIVRDHTRAAIREINLMKKMELRKKDCCYCKHYKKECDKYGTLCEIYEEEK